MAEETYQTRVVEEKDELYLRLGRLEVFMAGVLFEKLPEKEKWLLRRQRNAMDEYLAVLKERIEGFKAVNEGVGSE